MMRLLVIVALLVLYGLVGVQGCGYASCDVGYKYSKCELAEKLINLGVASSEVKHWVCEAEFESQFCTCATSSTRDHGLFQINGRWNCDDGEDDSKNGCNRPCSDFRDTYLDDDIVCMRTILRWQGNDWSRVSYGYRDNCPDIIETYLDDCRNI